MPALETVDELLKPQFVQPEVVSVAGIDRPTLQTWINRRLIILSEHNPGTGNRRLYSAGDVIRLAVMRRLTAYGVSVSRAATIGAECLASVTVRGRSGFAPDLVWVMRASPNNLDEIVYQAISGDEWDLPLAALLGRSRKADPLLGALGVDPHGPEDTVLVVAIGRVVRDVLDRLAAFSGDLA